MKFVISLNKKNEYLLDISQGIIKDGIITFPFKIKLPDKNIPSSFESKFGAIRYWFKTSLLPDSINCQHPFTVLEKINVNDKKYQVGICSITMQCLFSIIL